MKKYLIVLLIALSAVYLYGCSNSVKSEVTTGDNSISQTQNVGDNSTMEKSNSSSAKTSYGTISTVPSWVADPSIPENLMTDSRLVLKIVINEKAGADFYLTEHEPVTPYKAEVTEVIVGDAAEPDITVYVAGGEVTLNQYKNSMSEESVKKMGLDKYSAADGEAMFVDFVTDFDYDFEVGNEYIVIVNEDHMVAGYGYGIFKNPADGKPGISSNESFTNVLTDKSFPVINR